MIFVFTALGLLSSPSSFRCASSESHELSWSQKAVLVRLDTEGPATTAELARAEGVKPQSMGATVAALEDMGVVERKPHPTDGRQMNIALTAKGATVRKDAGIAKRTWLAEAIAKLDATDQKNLPAVIAVDQATPGYEQPRDELDKAAAGRCAHCLRRALRHRNFGLFFGKPAEHLADRQLDDAHRLFNARLVYRLTHSALLARCCRLLRGSNPHISGCAICGRLDRTPGSPQATDLDTGSRRGPVSRLLALTLAHIITLGEVIALTAFQGLINAFDMPARQSFLVRMVGDRKDLSNAIAINSSMADSARLIGPAIAGLVECSRRRGVQVFPARPGLQLRFAMSSCPCC